MKKLLCLEIVGALVFLLMGIASVSFLHLRLSWPMIGGFLGSLLIHYGKELVPDKAVLTTAELAAFQILHAKVTEMEDKVSRLNFKLGIAPSAPVK